MGRVVRKADDKGRLLLPKEFAGLTLEVEWSETQVVIRKVARVEARRYTNKELLSGMTEQNLHEPVEFRRAGNEQL